jgi:hypothetical protein
MFENHLHKGKGFCLKLKMAVFCVVAPCNLVKVYRRFRGVSCLHHKGDANIIIALSMVAGSSSETSVNFYLTIRRNNLEDSKFHTRRSENLKSHFFKLSLHLLHSGNLLPFKALKDKWYQFSSVRFMIKCEH